MAKARPASGRRKTARQAPPLRMKHLCEQTGLGRQAVHFYIQQGLVPEGQKTGRNMAYYSAAHVERLLLIRRLQEEHFLPLKAIRSVLEMYVDQDAFSPMQRQLLEAVRQKLRPVLTAKAAQPAMVPIGALLERQGLPRADFDELLSCGLLAVGQRDGVELIRERDVWLIETLAALRQVGLTRELGFTGRELALIDELVTTLFQKETALLTQRLAHLDATTVATMVQRALPHINTLLVRMHEAKLRDFIDQGSGERAEPPVHKRKRSC